MTNEEFNEQYLGSFEPRKQSDLLTQFYRAYLEWINDGAPEMHFVFKRRMGLCGNLRMWAMNTMFLSLIDYQQVRDEMLDQFRRYTTCSLHPFHHRSELFNEEMESERAHLNPARIQWVKDHAQ